MTAIDETISSVDYPYRKTLQTISFLAFLREKGTYGPFLVVAPVSTLANWIDEFEK